MWLISLTLRFASSDARTWMLVLVFLAVAADYLENWTHVTALKNGKVPRSKSLFSAAKWTALGVFVATVLFAWLA